MLLFFPWNVFLCVEGLLGRSWLPEMCAFPEKVHCNVKPGIGFDVQKEVSLLLSGLRVVDGVHWTRSLMPCPKYPTAHFPSILADLLGEQVMALFFQGGPPTMVLWTYRHFWLQFIHVSIVFAFDGESHASVQTL